MSTSSSAVPRRVAGRPFLLLGLGLAILGLAGYVLQVALHRLWAPWYLPALTTLGVVLVLMSLWQTRNLWRWLALLLLVALAGAEWTFLLGSRLPAYTGPVAAGKPFPEFTTARADGSAFTQRDLEGDNDNVLVFFRGRW